MLSIDGNETDKKLISEFTNAVKYNGESFNNVLLKMLDDYIFKTDISNMKFDPYIHDLLIRQERARRDAD